LCSSFNYPISIISSRRHYHTTHVDSLMVEDPDRPTPLFFGI